MHATSRSILIGLLLSTFTICAAGTEVGGPAGAKGLKIDKPGQMYALGVMLDEGLGVGVDEPRAVEWFKRAARLGHAESMNRLGTLCLSGRGLPRDAAASLIWFRRAVAQGSLPAMNNIALLYFYGFGVRQSYSRAAKWLKMSADKGNPEAQNKLAGLYVDGLGVDRNPGRAKVLYLKSAVQGYVPAMVNLGGMLSQGSNGETRDLFPYPLVDRSNSVNASIDVEQALLRIPDLLVVESCCRGVRERRTLECP